MELRAALLLFGTLSAVAGRAVNISNTWVLPEEGFPVFYRYFRDRISWYEADAVCQFHHANLVTVDSTSQYDAVRAYLRELDIADNIWIGLQRNGNKPDFQWTDFHPLSNNEHWQEAIPKGTDALCVAMDPAVDYRWHALSCGGPSIASFICELPVPNWATGPKGCLLTELPSLTVLYIPEQSALELTSDCGLDGTKRIACKGNANRDQMVKQLACTISEDFEDKSTKSSSVSIQSNSAVTENDQLWTSNAVDEYSMSTRHRRETEVFQQSTESTVFEIATSTSKDSENSEDSSATTPDVTRTSDLTTAREIHSSSEPSVPKEEEISSTDIPESSSSDLETSDYPSAINQGQLFGIIENGTNYDIIELNETGTEESPQKILSTSPPEISTATVNPKESESSKLFKNLYAKNLNDLPNKNDDKTLNKEVEMIPPLPGSPNMKLNRTNRKQLPMIEDFDETDEIDLDIDNKLSTENQESVVTDKKEMDFEHKTVEVKLHKGDKNETSPIILITTKINPKKIKKTVESKKEPAMKEVQLIKGDSEDFKEEMKGDNPIKEDPTTRPEVKEETEEDRSKYTVSIDDMVSTTQQAETSTMHRDLELIIEEQNKSDMNSASSTAKISSSGETTSEKPDVDFQVDIEGTGEPMNAPEEAQPRPNRQRQLTKTQRKTFYPYFFSRMLG